MKDKTIIFLNRVKLLLAIVLLVADILACLVCAIRMLYAETFLFLLIGGLTLDYIRIARKETKPGRWYVLEDMES